MATKSHDAWLCLGLAALGFYAAIIVHKQLVAIRQSSKVGHHDKEADTLNQRTENALKLETLGHLALNANQDIRAASIKIVTERLFQVGGRLSAWSIMIQDLSSSVTERRDKSLSCLRFVAQSSQHNENAQLVFHQISTFRALLNCLCSLLPQAAIAETKASYRSQPERDSLWILDYILPFYTARAVQADVIGKWLANYPFGGEATSLLEKKKIMRKIIKGEYSYEDSDFGCSMQSVLDRFFKIRDFRTQLEKHNLINAADRNDKGLGIPRQFIGHAACGSQRAWECIPEVAIRTSDGWTTGAVDYLTDPDPEEDWPSFIPEVAIRTSEGYSLRANARGREQSPEEQALRRRRREAMVLEDNGRPI